LFWLYGLAVLLLDQASKTIVRLNLSHGDSIPIIKGYWHVTYVQNPGGAFGLLPGVQTFLLLTSIVVMAMLIVYRAFRQAGGPLSELSLGLILGGTAGNLVDRVRFGEVIDWLDFRIWPVFNIADTALVIGLTLLAWQIIRSDGKA